VAVPPAPQMPSGGPPRPPSYWTWGSKGAALGTGLGFVAGLCGLVRLEPMYEPLPLGTKTIIIGCDGLICGALAGLAACGVIRAVEYLRG
jgi:hypothetical protein